MPITTKKCNLCHSELRVSDEAPVVVCPVCGCINGYDYIRSNQNDKYSKGAISEKYTGGTPNIQNHQQQPFSAAPTQGQAPLHVLLGGTKQPGSLHFVDTNSLFLQTPQASSPDYSPPLGKTTSYLQPPPQVSHSSQVSVRTLKTNYTSFQQLSQKSLSLQSSLPPVKTKPEFQLSSQISSQPIPERIINNFFQQPQQTSSPQGSPHPSYNNISYQQPFQTSSPPDQDEVNDYSWQPQKTRTPQGSPRPLYTNISHPQPFQTSSPPGQDKFSEYSWQPQKAQTPQGSARPSYTNMSHPQPFQTSSPPGQDKFNEYSWQPQKTPSAQGSPRLANSNTSYQPPLQSSPPPIQEKINSISELPHQSSPQELPHQPQTSSPQGSSPRPSRFSSFLRPRAAQIPPQASSPLAQNDEYSQKLSQPSSQISYPPSKEDNNGHNQISTPPSSEANSGFNQKPLLAATQMSAPQVQPLLQAARLPVNNNGQNYQKTVPDTRSVSSSIASKPPVTGDQNIQYGTNQGTSGKFATTNIQSAENQNSRNTSNQQPIQSSPQESPHQPQTSSPQGSSPRPSRFSSFLRPRAAQIPSQASSPLAHNDEYSQKLSQPSSQISSPTSKEDNNGHNQISTPPSTEADNGFSRKPLLATTQMSASQVQPLQQATRLPVNNNGQNYQKTVPETRPVSSSIAAKPPGTGEQNIQYGTNQGTRGKFATTNSQSAENQNSRNTEAFRGNLTGAPANYINKSVADADDDPHYTKRRLQEFREQLQI